MKEAPTWVGASVVALLMAAGILVRHAEHYAGTAWRMAAEAAFLLRLRRRPGSGTSGLGTRAGWSSKLDSAQAIVSWL